MTCQEVKEERKNEVNCFKIVKENKQENNNSNSYINGQSTMNVEGNNITLIQETKTASMINKTSSSIVMAIDSAMELKKKYLHELISSIRGYSKRINDIKRFSDSCDTYMKTENCYNSNSNCNTINTSYNNNKDNKPVITGNIFKKSTGISSSISQQSLIMQTPSKVKAVKAYLKQYEHSHETRLKIDLNGALSQLKLKHMHDKEELQSDNDFIIITLQQELYHIMQSIKTAKEKYIMRKKLMIIEENMKKVIELKKYIIDYYNEFINKQMGMLYRL